MSPPSIPRRRCLPLRDGGWRRGAAVRNLLRSQSQLIQIGLQPLAFVLRRVLDGKFASARTQWNGHASCLLLSFDCDFPEDVFALPEIVRELEGRQLRASFACVGRWVTDYPDEHRCVIEAGHELLNHTNSHPELVNSPAHFVSCRNDLQKRQWKELSSDEKRDEIVECQETVGEKLGVQMKGFRAPHFGKVDADDLYPTLCELGMTYATSVLACRGPNLGLPFRTQGILEIPITTCPRHPFVSFDSWHAFYTKGGWHTSDFGRVFEGRLEVSAQSHALTNIYLDPKDQKRYDLPRLLDSVERIGEECWAPTYSEFTKWHDKKFSRDAEPERPDMKS